MAVFEYNYKFAEIKEICVLLIFAGDRATVEAWRDAAKQKITGGGGQVTVLTSASLAGKSSGKQLVVDPVSMLKATLEALAEADSETGGEAQTRVLYPRL